MLGPRFEPEERPEDEWRDAVRAAVDGSGSTTDGQRRPARELPERRRRLVGDRRCDAVGRRPRQHLVDRLRAEGPRARDRSRRPAVCAPGRRAVWDGLPRANPRAERARAAAEGGLAPRGARRRSSRHLDVPDLPRGAARDAGDAERDGRRRDLRRLSTLPRMAHRTCARNASSSAPPHARACRRTRCAPREPGPAARPTAQPLEVHAGGRTAAARALPRLLELLLGAELGELLVPGNRRRESTTRSRCIARTCRATAAGTSSPPPLSRREDVPSVPEPYVHGQDEHGSVCRGTGAAPRRRAGRARRQDSVRPEAEAVAAQVHLQAEPGGNAPTRHHLAAQGGLRRSCRSWLVGELAPLVDDLLSESTLRRRGLVDPAVVARLRAENDAGTADNSLRLYALLSLDSGVARSSTAPGASRQSTTSQRRIRPSRRPESPSEAR